MAHFDIISSNEVYSFSIKEISSEFLKFRAII